MPKPSIGARPPAVVTPYPLWERRCLRYPPEWREMVTGALRVLSFGYYYDPDFKEWAKPIGERVFYDWLDAPECSNELCTAVLDCLQSAASSEQPIVGFLTCLIGKLVESCAQELADQLQGLLESVLMPQFRQVNPAGEPSALQVSYDGGNTWQTVYQLQDIEDVQVTMLPEDATPSAVFSNGVLQLNLPRGQRGERGEQGPQGPQGEQGPAGPAVQLVRRDHKVLRDHKVHKVHKDQWVHKVHKDRVVSVSRRRRRCRVTPRRSVALRDSTLSV